MRKLRLKGWLLLLLAFLPFWSAFNLGNSDYAIVLGSYEKLPFSLERAAIGFFIGLVFAGIIYGVAALVGLLVRWLRRGSGPE